MNYKIYAVDFDGTLCENKWPGIGLPNICLIEELKDLQKAGDKIILWTCRCDERLEAAVEWCRSYGLTFDAVNDNIQEASDLFGGNSRKIYADFYVDDKSVYVRFPDFVQ